MKERRSAPRGSRRSAAFFVAILAAVPACESTRERPREVRVLPGTRGLATALGVVERGGYQGDAQVIMVMPDGSLEGFSDRRRGGDVVGH